MREFFRKAQPQHGDIVVVHYPVSPIRWMVREMPDVPQFGSSSQDQALRLVRGYAQAHGVDLWSNDSGRIRLIERHRPGSIAQPMRGRSA